LQKPISPKAMKSGYRNRETETRAETRNDW
jgi:hypothetical protein